MCNSISNKKYINESIINSFIIGFDSEVTSTFFLKTNTQIIFLTSFIDLKLGVHVFRTMDRI